MAHMQSFFNENLSLKHTSFSSASYNPNSIGVRKQNFLKTWVLIHSS